MKNKDVQGSIVAGRDIVGSVNAQRSNVNNHVDILRKVRRQSFWISLLVGIISSLIASLIFHILVK